jgi:hypothetical protein
MGTIKTTNIETITGSGTLTLGQSGETISIPTNTTLGASGSTITIPSGCTITNNGTQTGFGGTMTPAFEVYLSATQTLTNATATKIQFNTEVFDTASAYDNATNYRFTVPSGQGGRYFVYNNLCLYDGQNAERIGYSNTYVYKNGSEFADYYGDLGTAKAQTSFTRSIGLIMNLSATDYIEIYARIGNTAGGSPQIYGYSSGNLYSNFGAYKIIE